MVQEDAETTPLMMEDGDASRSSAGPTTPPDPTANNADQSGAFDKVRAVAVGAAASITYLMLSSGMILSNKFLMREDVFPFPVTLTSMHMVCSLTFGMSLQRFWPSLYPAYPRVFGKVCADPDRVVLLRGELSQFTLVLKALLPFAPIAACGTIGLVTGNSAYRYSSVSFLQMIKESHIMFVYILMLVVGLDKFKIRMAAVISFVAVCAMVAVFGEVRFSWFGLSLQLIAGLAGSGQIVLANLLMSKSSVGKIDPLTLVLCTAPVILVMLIPANAFFWDARIATQVMRWLPFLAASSLLACALQISAATLICVTSGTGYSLVCVMKDLAIVVAAQTLLHEGFTMTQVMGFAGAIAGMLIYSAMKLFPEAFEPATAKL